MVAPMPVARYYMWVLRVLRHDHYERMCRVTVDVACWMTLTAQWPWVPNIDRHLQPFIVNDVSVWLKNSRTGRKPPNKQTFIASYPFTVIDRENFYCVIPLYGDGAKRPLSCHTLLSDRAGRIFIEQWKKCENLYRILTLYSDGAERTFIVSYPCTVMEQGKLFSYSEWSECSVRTFI